MAGRAASRVSINTALIVALYSFTTFDLVRYSLSQFSFARFCVSAQICELLLQRARCARQLSDATRRPRPPLLPALFLTCSTVAKASPSSSQNRITTTISVRSNDDGDNSTLYSVVDDCAHRFSTGKLQFAARQVVLVFYLLSSCSHVFLPSFKLMTCVGLLV